MHANARARRRQARRERLRGTTAPPEPLAAWDDHPARMSPDAGVYSRGYRAREHRTDIVRRWLKGVLPDPRVILESRWIRVFGTLLQDPNLWHLNRRSASGGVAVGLFMMYMPPFGQVFMAAAAAIKLRVNLPIAASLVWLSNPLTIPPMFYGAYALGAWLTGQPIRTFEPEFWLDWHNWLGVLGPLLLGCVICACLVATLGYLTVQWLWRRSLLREIARRRARYAAARDRMPSSKRQT
jgi:uncharacterized protein (DUF2062 family)